MLFPHSNIHSQPGKKLVEGSRNREVVSVGHFAFSITETTDRISTKFNIGVSTLSADKSWSFSLGVGRGVTIPHLKKLAC
jgi:hypothetical protein